MMSSRLELSLQHQCCQLLCRGGISTVEYALSSLPSHLAPALLTAAITGLCTEEASCIISHWPLPTLCLRDVLDVNQFGILDVEMGFDVTLFSGITSRKPSCRLQTLDLRGLHINRNYLTLIIQTWPLLSLDKSLLNVACLSRYFLELAEENLLSLIERIWIALSVDQSLIGRVSFGRLLRQTARLPATEVIDQRFKELLGHEKMQHPKLSINMEQGSRLEVLLDMLEFDVGTSEYLDFLLVSRLQPFTPVYITTSSMVLRSFPQNMVDVASEIGIHSAKFILEERPHMGLDGLCLKGVDLALAWVNWPLPKHWSCNWLTSLGFHDCSLDLYSGGRPRGHRRRLRWLIRLLSALPRITSLDLGDNYLAGSLTAILDAIPSPLERLRLPCCDFTRADVDGLVTSKHVLSLREFDAENCTSGFHGDVQTIATELLRQLRRCIALRSLHFSSNSLTDVNKLCEALHERCWPLLTSIDVSLNPLPPREILRLIESSLVRSRNMQRLCLPATQTDNVTPAVLAEMKQIIAGSGRTDLVVEMFPEDRAWLITSKEPVDYEPPFFR